MLSKLAILLLAALTTVTGAVEKWPQWRGPLATGVGPDADPPVEWSEKENVRWKTRIPGLGHSSPVVWGDHIFLTSALPIGEAKEPRYSGRPGAHNNLPVTHEHEFLVIAVSRKSGKILWKKSVCRALPREGGHESGSLASASPCTDGERVYAFFGSRGLYALDFKGEVQWKAEFGEMNTKHGHGEGSTPALHGNRIVVNWDHEEQSFVAAFDTKTGKEKWRVDRNERTSWSSPIIIDYDGKTQVIVSATGKIRSYDITGGKVIWEAGGLSDNVVASPVFADGYLYAGSSYNTRAMFAIRLKGANGDISESDHIVWSRNKRTPYVPSPLLYGDSLYFLAHYQAVLTRLDAKTGEEPVGPFRLFGLRNLYASPVGGGDRIYFTDRNGTTLVMTNARDPKPLAKNKLDDVFNASAALVGKDMLLRGENYLYCLSQ